MRSRQTSIRAYNEINYEGVVQVQQKQIISLLRMYSDGFTRQEVSKFLRMNINAVCGRVNELIKLGVLEEDGKKFNPDSGRVNLVVKYVMRKEAKKDET